MNKYLEYYEQALKSLQETADRYLDPNYPTSNLFVKSHCLLCRDVVELNIRFLGRGCELCIYNDEEMNLGGEEFQNCIKIGTPQIFDSDSPERSWQKRIERRDWIIKKVIPRVRKIIRRIKNGS